MARFEPHPGRRPAIVTGASGGIGAAIALRFAEAGHPVVLGARRLERCEELAEQIRSTGGEAAAVRLDLAEPDSVSEFCVEAKAAVGEIEIIVSNAGDVDPFTVVEADPHRFARQLAVNLGGAQQLCHLLVPDMMARRRGDVVFVTSDSAVNPRTHMAGYVASKAGLEGLATAFALETEGSGVRVGMVRPGPASTEQGSKWQPDALNDAVASWLKLGFLRHNGTLRAKEVADAVLTVVSVPRGTRYSVLEIQPEAPVLPVETPNEGSVK